VNVAHESVGAGLVDLHDKFVGVGSGCDVGLHVDGAGLDVEVVLDAFVVVSEDEGDLLAGADLDAVGVEGECSRRGSRSGSTPVWPRRRARGRWRRR
jgi:hypothetical protein